MGKKINSDSAYLLLREADIRDSPVSSVLDLNKFKFYGQIQK
jgi:hypothetical protein